MKYKVYLTSGHIVDVDSAAFFVGGQSYVFGDSRNFNLKSDKFELLEVSSANAVFPIENVSYITKAD